jgi:hypothetical protein
MGSARTPVRRKLLGSAGLLVVLLAAAEGLARLVLGAPEPLPPPNLTEQVHCAYDAQLGWRNLPSVRRADIYGPGRTLTNNARGFRALEEYDAEVPHGRTRVVCLGDSFTMGYGVDDRDTYPAAMQRLCPTVQTVNMGLGAYGLGQDDLWYLSDGTALQTDVLLFAFIDADFNRLGLDEFGGFPKPRVVVQDGELVVRNVPVERVFTTRAPRPSAWDACFSRLALSRLRRPPPPPAPAGFVERPGEEVWATLQVAARLFDELAALSAGRGQAFLLVYIPTGRLAGKEPSHIAQFVADHAARSGTPLIDLGPAFQALPAEELRRQFLPDQHLSEAGNAFVARLLLDALAERVEGFPACDG